MKYKVKLAVLIVMLCANAIADPVYLQPGPNLTYGSSSNNQSIMSSIESGCSCCAVKPGGQPVPRRHNYGRRWI